MYSKTALVTLVCLLVGFCAADIYMHNPRGSNNRLNEASANRANANRMFDSQNNNRGGYNVGDKNANAAGNNQGNQYRMKFFQSGNYLVKEAPKGRSELVVEWTNQHGCGGNEDTDPHKLNCNLVLQILCQDDSEDVAPDDGITLRDGSSTDAQNYQKLTVNEKTKEADFITRRDNNVAANKGLNEAYFSYDDCARRQRNKGLFLADQEINEQDESATRTRQNPNGNRNGYECPEERDYYPYWHPTQFVDIAVLAQNESMCQYYKDHSSNLQPKHRCVETFSGSGNPKHYSEHNNEADCTAAKGVWTAFYSMLELAPKYDRENCESDHGDGLTYKWGKPYDMEKINNFEPIGDVCFVQPQQVDCAAAGWTRTNHLGNGREGVPLNYTWVLPYFPSKKDKRCVLRIRYNISTDDYDPYFTDASSNGENSPIENDPLVDVGANNQALRLAINTAQTGRTFQDRSHVFILKARGDDIDDDVKIHNLNVRGKRGNIVQVYPAVEYDFVPNRLTITEGDAVHFQWTGSNTHNNGAPGGDGQTGDAGEGKGGTDRNNLLEMPFPNSNFPTPFEVSTMFKDARVVWTAVGSKEDIDANLALVLSTSAYYQCIPNEECGKESVDGKLQLNPTLDNADASFPGLVAIFEKAGEYFYMCSRNNNFTNRSQKGQLTIKAK